MEVYLIKKFRQVRVETQQIYTMKLIVCLHRAEHLLRSNARNLLLFADDINYTLLKMLAVWIQTCSKKNEYHQHHLSLSIAMLEQWRSESSISVQAKGNWWAFERDSRSITGACIGRCASLSLCFF